MNRLRYSLLAGFCAFFVVVSFLVRTALLVISFSSADLGFADILVVYAKGFVFDLAVATLFCLPYSLYLLLLPQRWNNSLFNRCVTYVGFAFTVFIIMFSFFAEFTFWEEFENRFNFIAVDYLIYTYEVVNNINQSYPLPLLIGGMLLLTAIVVWVFARKRLFRKTFTSRTYFRSRLAPTGVVVAASALFIAFLDNSWAENSHNRYRNELSKAGIYSFFAAFKNNELDYNAFYSRIDDSAAFAEVRQMLRGHDVRFSEDGNTIRRTIGGRQDSTERPNVILVCIESMSADFMGYFGNRDNITPFMDSLARKSILFTNLYATGTRTVRGMEALTLSIPPTPGNSIVRRPDNNGLFNVSTVFAAKGYHSTFIYGGDGYFDNMNAFFGNNGFDILDHGRTPGDKLAGQRNTIPADKITFENAWGICDEDIYKASISDGDKHVSNGQPFFHYIMTTSNHRPYTYPEGKVALPSGSGRHGAVQYTDYALRQFIEALQGRPWFDRTVVIVVADHCASSAGKNEINVAKYHIPCMIYNLHGDLADSIHTIDRQCSQIDVFPTLFSLLGWEYESNFYGRSVIDTAFVERAFVGTYQKLGYMQQDSLVVLSPMQLANAYRLSPDKTEQQPIPDSTSLTERAIAFYQSAYELFKKGKMRAE